MKILISLFLLFFAFTYANDDESQIRDENLTPLEFTIIASGVTSDFNPQSQNMYITTQAQWKSFLTLIGQLLIIYRNQI